MGQLVVRNIEETVKDGLRRRAKKHGRSMEEEIREILRDAAHRDDEQAIGLGTEIANIFRGSGITEPIPELRGFEAKPPKFR
jgi:plasmid stability protein